MPHRKLNCHFPGGVVLVGSPSTTMEKAMLFAFIWDALVCTKAGCSALVGLSSAGRAGSAPDLGQGDFVVHIVS